MNEETNEIIEQEDAQVEESIGSELTDEEFDAMWADDNDDEQLVEQVVKEDADQQSEHQPAPEEADQAEANAESTDADQYLELKHFDEVRKVTKEEAKTLAQKGMDYDRIRGKLSDAETANQALKKYEDFLNEIKGDFDSIDDLMMDTRARMMSDKDSISYEEAKAKLTAANQPKQSAAPTRDEVLETMRRESLQTFLQEYPDVKASEIPKEVWDDMQTTNNLVASYAKYQAKKLAAENETLKNNAKNKSRSIGSMKSYGGKQAADEIDQMWYDDDY